MAVKSPVATIIGTEGPETKVHSPFPRNGVSVSTAVKTIAELPVFKHWSGPASALEGASTTLVSIVTSSEALPHFKVLTVHVNTYV
ncbi:hypothetical protein BSU00_00160 [Tenacibaculum sp. SG-28]|nr:hypothetical protein BSU00_00160 [Tenacibaculum sp. SG-28]